MPAGGTHKVEFGGPGVEKGEVGAKSMYTLALLDYLLVILRSNNLTYVRAFNVASKDLLMNADHQPETRSL